MENRASATSTGVFSFADSSPAEIGEKRVEAFAAEIIFVGAGRAEIEGRRAPMTVVDGQDGVEDVVLRDKISSVGGCMVTGCRQCMGVGLE